MRRALFLLYPGFDLLDFAGPFQSLYEAQKLGLEIELLACGMEALIPCDQGIAVSELSPPPSYGPSDWVFVPGCTIGKHEIPRWLVSELREASRAGALAISTCTGAFVLGEAGLLDGRDCTTHWKRLGELERRYPRARVQADRLFVEDGGIVTSGGAACGIDLALHLIERERGPLFASKVARQLIVFMRRDSAHTQGSVYLDYRDHSNPGVHAVQDWLIENQGKPAGIEDLARIGGMSPRSLARSFREATGTSPGAYRNLLRLERAMVMLNDPSLTVEAVAEACGFPDAKALRRQWKKRYGLSPRRRDQGNEADRRIG
jgi:transcriptional regulator GlxA family with amidase domain